MAPAAPAGRPGRIVGLDGIRGLAALFVVLSGFSLALAPARSGWRLDSVAAFARRRAWRIRPPYWAALGFSLVMTWCVLAQPGHARPDGTSVVVYGVLGQDAVSTASPNPAFWSIAIEAQLYVQIHTGPRVRVVDTRALRSLGSFSYSLHLTHVPIVIAVSYGLVLSRVAPGTPTFLLLSAILLPTTVAFARMFAAVFETPFQRHRGWPSLRRAIHPT